jgi:hypothetical protein
MSSDRELPRGTVTFLFTDVEGSTRLLKQLRGATRTWAEPSDGLEPSTPSFPWKFGSVTRVHARSSATTFVLQISRWRCAGSVRACPHVLSLMYPPRTRGSLSVLKTQNGRRPLDDHGPGSLPADLVAGVGRPGATEGR